MTQSEDYRLYLEERFDAMEKDMHGQFISVHDTLDRIETHVKETNGRVGKLEDWKAYKEGAEKQKSKGFENTLKIIGCIVAFTAMMVSVYFGYQKTRKEVVNMLDRYSYDIQTRSWEFDKDSI